MSVRLLNDREEPEDDPRVAGTVEAMWLEFHALASITCPVDIPDSISNRICMLAGAIASTRAKTLRECVAKAKLLRWYEKEDGGKPRYAGLIAHSLHDDLERLLPLR